MYDLIPYAPAERLDNPATGEVAAIETSALADGGCASILFTLPAHAEGAPPHFHTSYDETFAVLEGALELRIGPALEPRILHAGDYAIIRRGAYHAFRNAGAAPVTFRTVASQGRGFERFIRAWYGLGRNGDFANGAPRNPLHLAMALDAGDINLVGPPAGVQRMLRRALTRLARLSGADRAVTQHWETADV
jgi:quercetin dioxygenase-like cupin family protein